MLHYAHYAISLDKPSDPRPRSETDAVSYTLSLPVGVKRVEAGRERRRGTLTFFFPRHSCMQERLVPFPLILLASSLQCMSFQLFQVLDFRLPFIESKLRNVFFSTPCKRGAKQTIISNLQNM